MGLSEFYQSVEDRYYRFMDSLESHGIKMYEWFINPIEDRGMPSMPFFILGVLLVLGLGVFAAVSLSGGNLSLPGFGGGNSVNVAVKVSSPDGVLSGVSVHLAFGSAVRTATTDSGGVATFKSVPFAESMTVSVSQDGYASYSQDFPVAAGKTSAVFAVNLQKTGGSPSQSVVLFVSDEQSNALANSEVRYLDPTTGNTVVVTTDAQGKVALGLSDSNPVSLSVSHDGYNSNTISCPVQSTTCQVTLTSLSNPSANPSGYPSPTPPAGSKGTVRVEIVDQNGNGLSGKVDLFRTDNGATQGSSTTDSTGVARFDNIDVGIDVYFTFTPDNASYSFNTSQSKTTIDATDFFLQLYPNAPGVTPTPGPGGVDFSKITVKAVDANKQPISGAQMQLFVSTGTLLPVSTVQSTDDSGQVVFPVDPSVHVFATLWAPGYLPARTRIMTGGDSVIQALQPVAIGNHGSVNVSVVDDAGVPSSGASVNFITADGFPLGVPAQDTGLDGTVSFDGLPLGPLRAVAIYGTQMGKSDVFSVSLNPMAVSIQLAPATAFVSVNAVDSVNKSAVSATFTAVLVSTGAIVGTCSSTGSSCTIQVPANRPVVVSAKNSNYVGLSSDALTIQPGSTFSKSFYLLPSSLSNQLTVLNAAVVDQNGRNTTVLDKGRIYSFTLQFNLPSNAQKAGAFIRVGTLSDAATSPMVLSDYSKPGDAQIVKGQTFNPGPSCAADLGNQNGPIQWVDWSYSTFGSRTVSADVFVKPSVTTKDQLVVQYRLYAQAGGAFVRNPEDARYGGAEKTADLDSCYAQTITIPLTFVDGQSTCNDNACISTLFQSASGSAKNGLLVTAGQLFNASIDLRAFNALDSPVLKITTSPSVEFTGYDFGTATSSQGPNVASGQSLSLPLSFFQRTSGTLRLRALLPTQSAQLSFAFGDSSGDILDASRYVVVQGTGIFAITPTPAELQDLQDNTLTVNVLSDAGIPVTNAKVSLEESSGSPFGGFPNGPVTIQGDGSLNNGKDGKYVFKNLKPTTVGKIDVVVTKDSFSEGRITLAVNATDPLTFGQDISNVQLDCKNPTTVTVQSGVNADLKVFGSFSGTGCASVQVLSGSSTSTIAANSGGSGTTGTLSFRVKSGKDTNIVLNPVLTGNCVLTFSSQTLSGQALGSQDMFINNGCAGPSPSVTATPPTPGQNCASLGGICANNGACPANYVVAPAQSTCQAVGGSCQSGTTCPSGLFQLPGVCVSNGYSSGVCCGSSTATATATASASATATAQPAPLCENGGSCCLATGPSCTSQGGVCAPPGSNCPNGYVQNTGAQNNQQNPYGQQYPYGQQQNPYGGSFGQQSCQSMGGTCVNAAVCPNGQYTLQGVCVSSSYSGGACCSTTSSVVTAQPPAVCANGGTCCQNVNNLCQPPIFNFQNIFAKYLGYYMGMQTLGMYPQQVTAASAPTQLVATPAGVTLVPGKLSPSCTSSGNGVTCKKSIFALMPTNAIAFSVQNQLFTTTNVLAKRDASSCYAVQEVGKQSGFSDIYNGILNDIASSAALLAQQSRTYVVTFKPGPSCVSYTHDADGWHVKPIGDALKGTDVIVSVLGVLGGTNSQFKIHFVVEAKNLVSDKYAFIAMPVGGKVTMRGLKDPVYEEPAVFANNIPVKSLSATVSGSMDSAATVTATSASANKLVLKTAGSNAISVKIATQSTSLPVDTAFVPGPTGLSTYDVVDNVLSGDASTGAGDSLICSRADYCPAAVVGNGADSGVLPQIKADLNDLAKNYVASVDTLAYEDPLGLNGGDGAAYQRLYQQAMQDALREYAGLQSQYQACVSQGQNPLSGIQSQCAQTGIAPIYGYPQTLPGAYGAQGFYGGYQPGGLPYGSQGYGAQTYGGYPGVNPALSGAYGAASYNPYQTNMYPGPGLYPGYVNPQLQGTFGNAFGTGFTQAGCNSGILNAFQTQGALGGAYFNPIQQQLMQQYSYSRGVYSNNKPVLTDMQPVIKVPIKEAGSTGGIKVYTFKADLSATSDTADFVVIDTLNSNPLSWSTVTAGTTTSLPKGSTTTDSNYGFPYLKYNGKDRYVLQNWNSPAASSAAPATTSSVPQTPSSARACNDQSDQYCKPPSKEGDVCQSTASANAVCIIQAGSAADSAGNYACKCAGPS